MASFDAYETSRFIFLANKQELPKTVAACKEIHEYLHSSNPGQKNTLGLIMQTFISSLTEKRSVYQECEIYREKLLKFYNDLSAAIENELPTFRSSIISNPKIKLI
jgi:hypothetical protein